MERLQLPEMEVFLPAVVERLAVLRQQVVVMPVVAGEVPRPVPSVVRLQDPAVTVTAASFFTREPSNEVRHKKQNEDEWRLLFY